MKNVLVITADNAPEYDFFTAIFDNDADAIREGDKRFEEMKAKGIKPTSFYAFESLDNLGKDTIDFEMKRTIKNWMK